MIGWLRDLVEDPYKVEEPQGRSQMSSFTKKLQLVFTHEYDDKDRPIYRTVGSFDYRIGNGLSGSVITVPSGTRTNLATIPRKLSWFYPDLVNVGGRYIQAAVLHDYMTGEFNPNSLGFSRWMADAIFRESLGVLGVPLIQRESVYFAVRSYATLTGKR